MYNRYIGHTTDHTAQTATQGVPRRFLIKPPSYDDIDICPDKEREKPTWSQARKG